MNGVQRIPQQKSRVGLAIFLPIILVGGGIGLYFFLQKRKRKCPDGVTPVPRNPFTGKPDLTLCPLSSPLPPPNEQVGSSGNGVQDGDFGDSGTSSSDKCTFPLIRGSQGYCVKRVHEALADRIRQEDANYTNWDLFTDTTEEAFDEFLEKEVGSDDNPLAKQKVFFGGCRSWLLGDENCRIFNDQYKQLLEKKGKQVVWSSEFNQWR